MAQTYQEIINKVKEIIIKQPIPPQYNPTEWKGKDFNCYAYALQACFNFNSELIEKGIFPRPNFISSEEEEYYIPSKSRVLEFFKQDCEALGFQLFPTDLKEQLNPNEYKIAVYVKKGWDFHFRRQDSNGKWSEKNGWTKEIEIIEEKEIVKDTENYEFLGIFKVSKK